jgi:hypothetical protein
MSRGTVASLPVLGALGLSALLAACAGLPGGRSVPAPPAQAQVPAHEEPLQEPPQAPAPPAAPAIPESRLLCTVQEGRRVSFTDLGVPAGSRPLDAALGATTVWVLFEPSLLLGIPRRQEPTEPAAVPEFGAVEEVAMVPGPRPDAWRSLAADWDGTLWLASPSGLWRMRPGRRPEEIIAAKASGFADVAAGHGAVWVAPACSTDALWKVGGQGRVLGTALPRPAAAGACAPVDLERDWSGDVWAAPLPPRR